PPKNLFSLTPFEGAKEAVGASLDSSSNHNPRQAPGWIEPDASRESFGGIAIVGPGPATPLELPGDDARLLHLECLRGDTLPVHASHQRIHGLQSSIAHFGMGLSTTLAPPIASHHPSHAFSDQVTGESWPVLVRSADDVRSGCIWPQAAFDSYAQLGTVSYGQLAPSAIRGVTDADAQQASQDLIASGVRRLHLSSSPAAAAPPLTPFGEYDDSDKPLCGQEWLQSSTWEQRAAEDGMQLPNLCATAHEEPRRDYQNAMWTSAQSSLTPSLGSSSREPNTHVHGGSESTPTSGNTSSLSSSRSLSQTNASLGEAWPGQEVHDLTHGDGDQRQVFPSKWQEHHGYGISHESGHDGGLSSYGRNHDLGARFPQESVEEAGPEVLGPSSSTLDANSHFVGGRMEEGCIGSKKRIWYRAPNGQFASATQAVSGQPARDEIGSGNGQGGSSGSEAIRRIRRRRKSEEVDRKYRCDFDGCDKAYGTLNHLNTHRATNEHGPRLNAVGYRRAYAEWERRQLGGQVNQG
ncbi:putative zinc finger protein, partial [Pseudozyma hubeiensis]